MNNNDDNTLDYDVYLKYRESLIQLGLEQTRSFDKYILTLSSGAIGLSLVLLKDIIPPIGINSTCLLIISWGFFICSILSTLISFITAKKACDKQLEQIDSLYTSDQKKYVFENHYILLTNTLNIISCSSFIIGIIFLCIFTIKNII